MILPLLALIVSQTSRTPVLTFHDVIERRGPDSVWFDCTTREFREILDTLANKGAHFVSLDALFLHLSKGTALPPHAVVITFADNYLGFYTRALPILRKRHIPAAMFVHTGFVGSPVGRPKMNWKQLQELDREGLVTIASQTVSHPADLRKLSFAAQLKEMTDSKKTLEKHLGHPVRYLAYPNGKFDKNSMQAAKQAGYLMAFSEELHPAEQSPSIFAVCRYVHTKWHTIGW